MTSLKKSYFCCLIYIKKWLLTKMYKKNSIYSKDINKVVFMLSFIVGHTICIMLQSNKKKTTKTGSSHLSNLNDIIVE